VENRQTRREFLRAAGGAGAALAVGGTLGRAAAASAATTRATDTQLSFLTWASDSELASFNKIISAFQAANAGITVKIEPIPFAQINTSMSARLAANQAPDIFRTTFNDIKGYAKAGGLKEFTHFINDPRTYGKTFVPALWNGVVYRGRAFGVPFHTDLDALVYNKDLFRKAGITKIPKTRATAWKWNDFLKVSRELKAKLGGPAFAYNWTNAGAYRWLSWLYMAGGQMITKGRPSVYGPAGLKTLAFFKTWHDEGLIPPTVSPRGTQTVTQVFETGTLPMGFFGDFSLPTLANDIKTFEWGATYNPRDKFEATDLGGTCVAISKNADNAAAAAKFLKFLATPQSQRTFCVENCTIPALNRVNPADLNYATRPDLMPIYLQQAKTLPSNLAYSVSIPNFTQVNTAMLNELEAFINSGQSAPDTLKHIDAAIAAVL